jgi:hypothetical protein
VTDSPRKVYLATAGEYSDYRVLKAFTNSDDAWAYPLGDDVLELELHDGPVEVRMWSELWWWPHQPDGPDGVGEMGNPHESHAQKDFDGRPKWVEHRWSHNTTGQSVLVVEGWDVEGMRKVYSEQRAQHLARQDLGIAADHCRPGRCMGLMCCSYECSRGRCQSIPASKERRS